MADLTARCLRLLSPLPETLFHVPMEYLSADHFRQDCACRVLEDVADTVDAGDTADETSLVAMFAYLMDDLPRHMADEEDDLFPRLVPDGKGNNPDAPLALMVQSLTDAHHRLDGLRRRLCTSLQDAAKTGTFTDADGFCHDVEAFCTLLRWIVRTEDTVILPAMETLFVHSDWEQIGAAMAGRRNTPYPVSLN